MHRIAATETDRRARPPAGASPRHRRPGTRRPGTKPRATRSRRGIAAILAAVLIATLPNVAGPAAWAADYPSWDDVEQAKSDTKAGKEAVSEIKSLIGQLEDNVAVTRAEAERRTDELFEAQQAYDEATRRAAEIQAQADESAAEAAEAEQNAGQVAAQLYRSGGTDLSVNLLLEGASETGAQALLSKLGNMEKMVERTSGIYEEATQAQNNAASLADQAEVARGEQEKLRKAAEEALQRAIAAQQKAEAALAESEKQKIRLEEQLKFLQSAEKKTVAQYEEGERKRKEEEERRRKEEERRRQEALENGGPAAVATSGWALPASGGITGDYGPREVICENGYCSAPFHYATDIGTGCWAPIFAANSGTVEFAGWSGSYGNFVKVNHGGGISTGYAHIVDGGILVGPGQWVGAGQQIAWTGTTGASTGCHLHFEVYEGWDRIDPVSFMAARGVFIG
ncbi:peptidoglycan DD-metalloendopeptidase family protein [Agromyces archimandritae]|uniref:Peptidoglycan DD-metalloendopeptidase family protein n=1 Tax=Agromyces archimandritae TaxID=2781962 RepID=A0A975FPD5_9MICO|nr:M23 family metallopeptidase [Agromyces archimandritae]QTX05577.1 peptidoglycan DD-metalloendopeptidase family protein [Agromyces archimandritae]